MNTPHFIALTKNPMKAIILENLKVCRYFLAFYLFVETARSLIAAGQNDGLTRGGY